MAKKQYITNAPGWNVISAYFTQTDIQHMLQVSQGSDRPLKLRQRAAECADYLPACVYAQDASGKPLASGMDQ